MPEQSGERSQEPTPHRREKAREEGQVAKSHDLVSAVLLLAGVSALMFSGEAMVEFLGRYGQRQLGGAPWLSFDVTLAVGHWNSTLWDLSRCLLPILGTVFLAAILVNVAQGGFLFLPDKASPDLSRIDPFQGLQRLFSASNGVRLAFGIFKILVVGVVAFVSLYYQREAILGLTAMDLPKIGAYLTHILLDTTLKIAVALLILAILDYAYERWKYERDLRMTPQEVREEMKNLEGDPQIAARRRVVQRQLMLNRVSHAVPKADVVVTNPTELAVALQYDAKTMAAPVVVAKGAGLVAERIRRLALEHGIPVLERKPLARALYREVEVNRPIPPDKYAAVAEVLAYVYQLRGKKVESPASRAWS